MHVKNDCATPLQSHHSRGSADIVGCSDVTSRTTEIGSPGVCASTSDLTWDEFQAQIEGKVHSDGLVNLGEVAPTS